MDPVEELQRLAAQSAADYWAHRKSGQKEPTPLEQWQRNYDAKRAARKAKEKFYGAVLPVVESIAQSVSYYATQEEARRRYEEYRKLRRQEEELRQRRQQELLERQAADKEKPEPRLTIRHPTIDQLLRESREPQPSPYDPTVFQCLDAPALRAARNGPALMADDDDPMPLYADELLSILQSPATETDDTDEDDLWQTQQKQQTNRRFRQLRRRRSSRSSRSQPTT